MAPSIRNPINTEWNLLSPRALKPSIAHVLERSTKSPSHSSSVLLRSAKSFCITGDGTSRGLSRKLLPASHGRLLNEPPRKKRSKTSIIGSARSQDGSVPCRLETSTKANATLCNDTPFNNDQYQKCSSPHEYLMGMLNKKYKVQSVVRSSLSMPKGYFVQPTRQNTCNYAVLSNAVRSRNIDQLRNIQMQQQKQSTSGVDTAVSDTLYCCNKFGESILHMACRRGFTDVVQFLLTEGKTSLRIVDDYGRTPLHDACWTSTPNPELLSLLIKEAPELLLVSDKRGHAPLQYTQRTDYPTWIAYLKTHENDIMQ